MASAGLKIPSSFKMDLVLKVSQYPSIYLANLPGALRLHLMEANLPVAAAIIPETMIPTVINRHI